MREVKRYGIRYYRVGEDAYHQFCYLEFFGRWPPEDRIVIGTAFGDPGPDGPPCGICGRPIQYEEIIDIID